MGKNQKLLFNFIFIALLTAIEIVLSRFLSISLWNLKLGLSFIPVILAARLYGPIGAAAVAGLGDLLGALFFPIGAYFPGFTVSAAITGLIFGLFLKKSAKPLNVVLSVLITQIFCSLIVNTICISVLYGSPFWPLLLTRCVQTVIMIILEIAVTFLVIIPASARIKKFILNKM